MEKPKCGTELYHDANFHADPHEISSLGKRTYFPYRGLHAIHFLESCHRATVTPHLARNAETYRFRDIRNQKIYDLGPVGGTPKGETLFRDQRLLSCMEHSTTTGSGRAFSSCLPTGTEDCAVPVVLSG